MARVNKEAQHSPGPWRAVKASGKASAFHIHADASADNRSTVVAHIPRSTVQPMAANARLIAAAPDLLNAARAFVAPFDGVDMVEGSAVERARTAISRAMGGAQ